jgi:hypothetical protein
MAKACMISLPPALRFLSPILSFCSAVLSRDTFNMFLPVLPPNVIHVRKIYRLIHPPLFLYPISAFRTGIYL